MSPASGDGAPTADCAIPRTLRTMSPVSRCHPSALCISTIHAAGVSRAADVRPAGRGRPRRRRHPPSAWKRPRSGWNRPASSHRARLPSRGGLLPGGTAPPPCRSGSLPHGTGPLRAGINPVPTAAALFQPAADRFQPETLPFQKETPGFRLESRSFRLELSYLRVFSAMRMERLLLRPGSRIGGSAVVAAALGVAAQFQESFARLAGVVEQARRRVDGG